MRPVNRAVPAANTYPPDFNSLPQQQKEVVQLLHALHFETMTAQCEQMAAQLKLDYSIDMVVQRAVKKRKQHAGAVEILIVEASWNTYADLAAQFNAAQNDYGNRPNPPNSNDPNEKDEMVELYKTLKGITLRKATVIKNAQGKLPALYGRSRRQLITNIGQYCSYCELPLAASLAVEHMLPKSDFPLVSLIWDNFLLACPLCNSYKNDKPTRERGVQLSPNLGAHIPAVAPASPPSALEEGWIKDAAIGSYLWPSDAAHFTTFEQFFQYQMVKVLYDDAGQQLTSANIAPVLLGQWIKSNQLKFESDSGNAVIASVKDKLGEFNSSNSSDILRELQGDQLSPILIQQLHNYRLVLDPAPPSPGKIILQPIDGLTFDVIERRKYFIDLSGNPRGAIQIVVKEVDAETENNPAQLFTIALTREEQSEFRARLISGLLPQQLANAFTADAYKVDVLKDSVAVSAGRTDCYITIDKTYRLRNDGGILEVYGVSKFQVELHLVPVAGPLSPRAQQVIDDLKLNNVNAADKGNKITDRRMIKRTRTWFIAVESMQRLFQTVLANNPVPPYTELLSAIAETAKATGYWSVWRMVFREGFSAAPPVLRTAIMQFLSDVNNFPGTR